MTQLHSILCRHAVCQRAATVMWLQGCSQEYYLHNSAMKKRKNIKVRNTRFRLVGPWCETWDKTSTSSVQINIKSINKHSHSHKQSRKHQLHNGSTSGAGVRTVWGLRFGGGQPSEHSTSWTRPSTPPSAASETLQVTRISASSSSCQCWTWVVKTETLGCGGRGWPGTGSPAGGLFCGHSTAWRPLSRPLSSVSEPLPAARTSAPSSSWSWGDWQEWV